MEINKDDEMIEKSGHANMDAIVDRLMNQCPSQMRMRENVTKPLPSRSEILKVVETVQSVILPKCYGPENVDSSSLRFHMGAMLDRIYHLLKEQFHRGFCFRCDGDKEQCDNCEDKSAKAADIFLTRIPKIADMINTDIHATYIGDPAAIDEAEVVFCYPGVAATLAYRIAHEINDLGFPIIARIISEKAHSDTGIDIHPGADIGSGFMIDHGTGVVIGETCRIGRNVRIYQGVTLGAKSFPLDKDGNPIKGVKRHPQIEDDVIIYSGATLLGNIVIGKGSVIGGNVWLTESVEAGTTVLQRRHRSESYSGGGGI